MRVPLSLAARLARVTALRDVIDANGGGKMLFYAGTLVESPETAIPSSLLATLPLATPSSGSVAATGTPATVATLSLTPVTTLATAAGAIGFARIADGAGNGVLDLPVGLAGSGMPVILSALQVYEGGEIKLVSCLIQE